MNSWPLTPSPVLISTDGIQQQYFTRDAGRAEFRTRIRANPWMPREKLETWQLGALNRLLRHARDSVPLYAERLPREPLRSLDDIASIPVLTRDEVVIGGALLHSSAFAARDVLPLRTGGTCGSALYLRCAPAALARHYAHFARFREWIGIPDGARVAVFGGRVITGDGAPPWRLDANGALLCSADCIDGDCLEECAEALADFAPDVIDGFPSTLEPLARHIKARGLSTVRPMAVVTSGDILTPTARRLLEEIFHAPVFDHYGSAEMAASITQCRAGSYHINGDYGLVEILHEGRPVAPGETGEIVSTGFLNDAMPLIRYATGDMAVRGVNHCACGRSFGTIERIIGRADDIVATPGGHASVRLDPVIRLATSMLEARVIQDAPDHVTVEAVAAGEIDPMEAATLLSELRQRLGPDVRADLVRVPRIPRERGGRYRAVQALRNAAPNLHP